jgi:hypothetical protein
VELSSAQATLLALMALVRRHGNRVVIPAHELAAAIEFESRAAVNDRHELIFEVVSPDQGEPSTSAKDPDHPLQ